MDHSPGCSALEDLAAFVEGRLRGSDRDRVVSHLSGCAECREVLAESMEIADDLALEGAPGGVAPLLRMEPASRRRFGSTWRLSAAAAAAVAVMATVVGWQVMARQRPPSRADWLAETAPPRELLPYIWGGVVMRGGDETGESVGHATELGALLVDVDIALAASDTERARDILHRMATILDDAGIMESDVDALRRIAELDDVGRMQAVLDRELTGLEQRMGERFGDFYLRLGTFAEEAQIAASSGHADFLSSRSAQRYMRWLLSQREEQLDEDVREALLELQRAQSDPALQADAAMAILRSLSG